MTSTGLPDTSPEEAMATVQGRCDLSRLFLKVNMIQI